MYYQMRIDSKLSAKGPIKMSSKTALMKTPAATISFSVSFHFVALCLEKSEMFFSGIFTPNDDDTILQFSISVQNVLTSRATITIRHSRLKRIDQFHKEKGNSKMLFVISESNRYEKYLQHEKMLSRRLSREPDCVSGLEVAIGEWKSCVKRFESILGLERFIL